MPLERGSSRATFARNLAELNGPDAQPRSRAQKLAIAYSEQRRSKKPPPKKK